MSDDTEYMLATSAQDYRRCKEFLAANGMEDVKLSFPTVYAKRYLSIVGVLGTLPRDDMILAGPLMISVDGNAGFIALNLKLVYESLLRKVGVKLYNLEAVGGKYIEYIRRLGDFVEGEQLDVDRVMFKRYL